MACGLICSIIDMNICIIIYLLILGTLIYKSWRLRNFRESLKNYCEGFNNPQARLEEMVEECSKEDLVSNTWVNKDYIINIKKFIFIASAKLLWVDSCSKRKPSYKGGTTLHYYLKLFFDDGDIIEVEYNNIFNIKRVLMKISKVLPHVYIGEDEQLEDKFDNIEELAEDVHMAKEIGKANSSQILFNDSNLYGNKYHDFRSYKHSKDRNKVIRGLKCFLFMLLSIIFIYTGLGAIYTVYQNITKCTEPVNARISDIEYFNERVERNKRHITVLKCRPIYSYDVDGEEIEVESNLTYEVDYYDKQIGDTIELYYDPNDVEHYYDRTKMYNDISFEILLILLFIGISVWFIHLGIVKNVEMKQELSELERLDEEILSEIS